MPKGRPDKGYALTPQREVVLRILVAAGGSLHDEGGLVVSKLRTQIKGYRNTQALSMLINQLEKSGLVRREVVGRRTYHLALVEDALAPEDRARLGLSNQKPAMPVRVVVPDMEQRRVEACVAIAEARAAAAEAEVARLTRIIVRQSEMLAQA